MAEYIDKQTVIDTLDGLCDIVCQYSKKQRAFMCGACNLVGSAFDVLQELPAADVTPVVRCKECFHSKENGFICTHPFGLKYAFPNSFCSCAMKMDGGSDDGT